MNLVVYEHITSGALCDEQLPASLAHEGEMMLYAIVQDLLQLNDIHITILQDKRLSPPEWLINSKRITIHSCANQQQFEQQWQTCLGEHAYFLLIAPETDHTLLALQQQVLAANKTYFGCSSEATMLCSDKLRCYHLMQTANIPTPTSYSASNALLDVCLINQPYIVKPLDGAGCLETFKFDSVIQSREYLFSLPQDRRDRLIVQPYIEGATLSLSIYVDGEDIQLLSINEQLIEQHASQLVFHGCAINSDVTRQFSQQEATQLAINIHQAIAGLSGYVGIDFILSKQGPVVVDINPRLTTAYVYLSANGLHNPALPLWQHLQRLDQQEAQYA
ncbi:ATP-grasp domain-containing protein [Methylophaga muralis]|uniref:Carbamoyl phosphate synthase-like protein n=1 Tax=Methylophaga muralis TaxID=291169 RepID=A0A1E3GWY9_9GAMM|nr:ATP-grasp domain-containing protein [Methylophaga muralis]ODN68086.1 carbamoyl phosphate synthase-like protein [Methylophaga muralis]